MICYLGKSSVLYIPSNLFFCRTPILHRILFDGVKGGKKSLSESKQRGLITVLCKVAAIRNQNLNAYQKLTGMCLRTSGTSKNTITKLNKLYECVSYNTLTSMLDNCKESSSELMKQWATSPVTHAGDNLDIRSKARFEADGVSSHDIHLYTNMVYKARISTEELSCDSPAVDINNVDYSKCILNGDEQNKLVEIMEYSATCSLKRHLGGTFEIKEPYNEFAEEMAIKTEKVYFLIKFCDVET